MCTFKGTSGLIHWARPTARAATTATPAAIAGNCDGFDVGASDGVTDGVGLQVATKVKLSS